MYLLYIYIYKSFGLYMNIYKKKNLFMRFKLEILFKMKDY